MASLVCQVSGGVGEGSTGSVGNSIPYSSITDNGRGGKRSDTRFDRLTIRQLLWYGALVRAALFVYSTFHEHYFRVKYTDIDYMIIVDGAEEMLDMVTPFHRTTYRYTPLLAFMMLPAVLFNPLGKLIFMGFDLGAAAYCYTILRSYATEQSAKWAVSIFILFNPVVLNVSTRGNSDMVMTFMSMCVIAQFMHGRLLRAALILGFAIHFKLYPVIYTLPLVLATWEQLPTAPQGMSWRLRQWLKKVVQCGLCTMTGFLAPTLLCYSFCGKQYIDEAFLYHARREDHRHNFSPYWLLMYLNMGRRALQVGEDYSAGWFAFIPQAIVLAWVAWRLRRNVAHACCVMTVLFVAFNKVCTVQYFVWFLPFMAFVFCEPLDEAKVLHGSDLVARRQGSGRPSVRTACLVISLWSLTIPLWVAAAYLVEFEGRNCYGRLWVTSCVYFVATVGLACWLGHICRHVQDMSFRLQQNERLRKHI